MIIKRIQTQEGMSLEIGPPFKVNDFESFHPEETKTLIFWKTIPDSFSQIFKQRLTALHLKEVCFRSCNDLRALIFQECEAMLILELQDIFVSSNAPSVPLTYASAAHRVPSLRKLSIANTKRDYDKTVAYDVFVELRVEELIQNYSSTLRILECGSLTDSCRFPNQDIFGALKSYGAKLTHLSYKFLNRCEFSAFSSFVKVASCHLKDVRLEWESEQKNVFNELFGGTKIDQLERISTSGNDWALWNGDKFTGLKEIAISGVDISSFSFLSKMPNLTMLKISLESNHLSKEEPGSLPRAVNVHTLELRVGEEVEYFEQLSAMFPNVKSVKLLRKDRMLCYRHHKEGPCFLEQVCKSWPRLEHVEFSGSFAICLSNSHIPLQELGQGCGNETTFNMRHLPKMPCLQSFIFTSKSAKKVYFGDEAAEKVFLKIPNLKTLRIYTCAMSDQIVDLLMEKLQLFTFVKRV